MLQILRTVTHLPEGLHPERHSSEEHESILLAMLRWVVLAAVHQEMSQNSCNAGLGPELVVLPPLRDMLVQE